MMNFCNFKKCTALGLGIFLVALNLCAKETPVTLTTEDKWKLAALYEPASSDIPTVVLLHDLNKNKNEFTSFKAALAKNGFGYVALDLRGHGQSTGGGGVRSFAKEGVDNQFNKMTRDVDAAIYFLKEKGISPEKIVLLGAGLGANVAAKATTFWPNVSGIALISPSANVRDVLAIPPLRLYKGNVLIAAAAADKKMFLEASVIRNVTYLTTGEDAAQVTFLTAYDLKSHEMLDKYLTPSVLQWLRTPKRPEILPDAPSLKTQPGINTQVDMSGLDVAPSATEEALVPSVLEE